MIEELSPREQRTRTAVAGDSPAEKMLSDLS